MKHVSHEHNTHTNILSKLTSTKKKGENEFVIQEILSHRVSKNPLQILTNVVGDNVCWMTPVYNYLVTGEIPPPPDHKEANVIRRRGCTYFLVEDKMYKQGFSIPLLKCVKESKVAHILREIHEGDNTQHLRGKSLTGRFYEQDTIGPPCNTTQKIT